MGAARGVSGCARLTVAFLNLAMLVVALAVIALALWIRLDKNFEEGIRKNILVKDDALPLNEIKKDIRIGITVSFWVIIGFSIACVFIGLIGLLGAAARSRLLLIIYFVTMVILIALEIAVGIAVLVYRKHVRTTVKQYVEASYNLNTFDVQTFQLRYDCCGVENYANPQCGGNQPTCSSAVWDRLDFTLMVFGWSMLGVVILQIISSLFSLVIVATRSRYADA